MNEATIGAGDTRATTRRALSQNGARHAIYSAKVSSKSARDVMATIFCLNSFEGPNRFAYHGATLRNSLEPWSSTVELYVAFKVAAEDADALGERRLGQKLAGAQQVLGAAENPRIVERALADAHAGAARSANMCWAAVGW